MDHLIKFLVEVKAHETMFKLCEKFGMAKTAAFASVIFTAPVIGWKLPEIISAIVQALK